MSQSATKQRSRFNSRFRRAHKKAQQFQSRRLNLEALEPRTMLTGTWTPLTNLANAGVARFALLSNGSVLVARSIEQWGGTNSHSGRNRQLREWNLVRRGGVHAHAT